ncbi:MAG: hypothetical protein AAF183_09890 [Pseudomonadota bacterium]
MAGLNMQVWDRKRWQTERDKAGVSKGACSKISVGSELDKFHKAYAKDYVTAAKQAKVLKGKLDTYCASVKKKHPKFEKLIKDRLMFYTTNYISAIEGISASMTTYPDELKEARTQWARMASAYSEWKGSAREGEAFKHPALKPLCESMLQSGNAAKNLALLNPKYKAHGDALAKLGSVLDGGAFNEKIGDKIDQVLKMSV